MGLRAALFVLLTVCASCVTPPLVMSGGAERVELGARRAAWGAERVELELGAAHGTEFVRAASRAGSAGPSAVDMAELSLSRARPAERLRGLYVPAAPGAPLVLHFLGSSGSVTVPQRAEGLAFDLDELFEALRERGYASLAIDYRGVGASEGERDPRNVPADALAMWNEALRRVDGDPQRIVLRGLSLGTLAAASLLERGLEPASVVLIAPVRAESAARNWLRARRGALLAGFAAPFLARPMDVDLLAALEGCRAPLTLVVGLRDALLPRPERELVVERALSRGAALLELDLDHLHLVHAGYSPLEFGLARSAPDAAP
jgi:pimeloyl-ACP methyl ester carboxylesterase